MAGSPTFTRAKHFTHFHTSHKSVFEGAETQHVKTNLTASIDGNYEIKADKITMADPVVFESTASLDGDIKIGGDLYVTGSMIVVATVLHQGDNTFGDEAGDNQKLVGTTTASGDLNVSASLLVDKAASLDGTLKVGGVTTLSGILHGKTTASLDSDLNLAGDAIITGSLLVDKNASIDGELLVGGAFKYDQFITASALQTDPTLEGATGTGVGGSNDGWMKYWDITNATYIFSPYWNRG